MKRHIFVFSAMAIFCFMLGANINAYAEDYLDIMLECAQDDCQISLEEGLKYETMRNEQLELSESSMPKSFYFSNSADGEEIYKNLLKYQARYGECDDILAQMETLANTGDTFSIELGTIYEERRNNQIENEELAQDQTSYFTDNKDNVQLLRTELAKYIENDGQIEEEPEYEYTEDELYRFTQLMCAEIGSTWIPKEQIEWTASVVVNQLDHSNYADTLWGVITDKNIWYPNQAGTWNRYHPSTFERFDEIMEICRDVLENGSKIPSDIVYFAEFQQGSSIWAQRYDTILGSTNFWCKY